MTPRPALPADLPAAARLWHRAWHEAHDPLVPAGIAMMRRPEDFATRLAGFGAALRVAGPEGAPVGLCVIRADELHQLFVAADARGSGVAAALLEDGESRLARNGIRQAWLDVVVGNQRAMRFYDKHGWRQTRRQGFDVETPTGIFPVEIQYMEKTLAG